ncbi:serine/threonine-protein kinase [Streptomyces sp. ME02-8801-2C]|uniref:serine/threonine-protein kinase n=1 Tax=Streptomyces sp. ME02-8801-2C TaxID=3028680 RepID=UPI0029AD9DC3|nr:serine/threonine-protein kinase [Streptomyces sp. ME02-8801-2C]MDX3457929.1 serine/threonine-protein kinase [Streptomyces sp. ME02-8801-2C]
MSEADRGTGHRVVDGRFELEARLGGGGMGTVWRARDLVLHRLVAVKEVRPPDRDLAEYDPEGARMLRERVLREARALARIDHPNVVTVHHIVDGGEGTYPWIVMELVSGGSLADRLAGAPMTPSEAARTGRGVLAALIAAHAAGIQHRDVKPANVLLRPDGRPVLTDFGIAAIREATSLTATGSIIGTPDFMAPERISGHEGGAASDLWSLAMMLYAAVEGHHPLRRGTTLATLAAVLHDDVPPPVRSGALGEVLMSVLVRDPSARLSAEVLDRRLAEIESAPPGTTTWRDEPTSYPLNPPSPSTAPPASWPPAAPATPDTPVGAGAPGLPSTAVPAGFGPPPVLPGPVHITPQPVTAPVPGARRGGPGPKILWGVPGITLAAVLLWWLLPLGGDSGDGNAGPSTSTTPSTTPSTTSSANLSPQPSTSQSTPSTPAPAAQKSDDARTDTLLTPAGIRTVIDAFKKDTGRDRFGDFTVYEDYAIADVMLNGSDTKFDSYTYRPGKGVERGIISNSLSGGNQPFRLDGFNWDRVPALLEEADKKLNVADPKYRYLMVRQPNTLSDEPLGMALYLTDDYGAGFLEADPQGKVTDVSPA